jgi:hypothetical protein
MRRFLSFGHTSRERTLFGTWVVFCVGLSMFFVFQAASDGGPQHQTRRPRPIDLGVSGIHVTDCQDGYVGTLGSLVKASAIRCGPSTTASASDRRPAEPVDRVVVGILRQGGIRGG